MVVRHVAIKLNVPRPGVSGTHPTNVGGVDDKLVLQFEQAVAFIGEFITTVSAL